MHKFIKLFSRPNTPGNENKFKSHNESITKRKLAEKNKKVEKTKSNSNENLLTVSFPKRSVNSVENLDEAKEVLGENETFKEKDSAVSLESVFSEENTGNMDNRKTSARRILKAPSSSNILMLKKDAERIKTFKAAPIKAATRKSVPEPKISDLKS